MTAAVLAGIENQRITNQPSEKTETIEKVVEAKIISLRIVYLRINLGGGRRSNLAISKSEGFSVALENSEGQIIIA